MAEAQAQTNGVMNGARLHRMQSLFHAATDVPVSGQREFLNLACGGDACLVADVLLMLEEDRREGSLLDGDLSHLALQLLEQEEPSDPVRQCGPYHLKQKLGEGGMGVVYLAERDDLGSVVAIKILRDVWYSAFLREQFFHEQKTLAQLVHPFVARLYDAGILPDGTPWFAMEYVEGVSITDYCQKHGSNIETRLKLFRSACEAVQYAHERAVIHRDLKPSNILVKPDEGVRLLDFGIAKHLVTSDIPVDRTRTELRFLTLAYAAPEQVLGGAVGIFTDVYALGLMLYELLAGCRPLDLTNRTAGETERIIVDTIPEKPSIVAGRRGRSGDSPHWNLRKNASADLDVLCLTAIQKDPGRRYRSAEALIRDIDHYLHREPLEARGDSLQYRVGKFVRRNKRSVWAASAVFATVLALITFFTLRLATARNAEMAAAARTERVQQFVLNLFEGGDASSAPSENLRVLTLVDRGVQEAQTLTRDRDVQAQIFLTLGGIYQKLGKFDRADTLIGSALTQLQSHMGVSDQESANALIHLGLLRLDQGRFAEAESLVRKGRDQLRSLRPPRDDASVQATVALGKVLEARGAYAAAIPLLEEAVQFQSKAKTPTAEAAGTLKQLADSHFYAGNYDVSDALTRRALTMHRQLFGERHPSVADDLINLGATQEERGHYPEAERLYRQALTINQSWYGKDHPQTASNLYMLAKTLVPQRRFDEAEPLLQRALAVQERVYGHLHPHVANVLNELCIVASQRGYLDKAEKCYQQVVSIYEAVYGSEHYQIALGLSNLANVYLDKKEYSRAEQIFRDVIARYKRVLSPDHLYIGIAEIKLGRTLVKEQRYADAEEHTRTGYRIVAKQASPAVSWLQAARKDLAAIYEQLGQREKAVTYRAEIAQMKTGISH